MMTQEPRTLSCKECAALAGVYRTRWIRMVEAGVAPQPLNPGERYKIWSRQEVEDWLAGKRKPDSTP